MMHGQQNVQLFNAL